MNRFIKEGTYVEIVFSCICIDAGHFTAKVLAMAKGVAVEETCTGHFSAHIFSRDITRPINVINLKQMREKKQRWCQLLFLFCHDDQSRNALRSVWTQQCCTSLQWDRCTLLMDWCNCTACPTCFAAHLNKSHGTSWTTMKYKSVTKRTRTNKSLSVVKKAERGEKRGKYAKSMKELASVTASVTPFPTRMPCKLICAPWSLPCATLSPKVGT